MGSKKVGTWCYYLCEESKVPLYGGLLAQNNALLDPVRLDQVLPEHGVQEGLQFFCNKKWKISTVPIVDKNLVSTIVFFSFLGSRVGIRI
jgi:hypothetical protein